MLTAEHTPRAGQLRFVAFESKLLHGNRFGDPVVRHHPVYLPPSYDRAPDRRFPVVYGLAGYGSGGFGFFAPGLFAEPLHARLDRLIAGGMPELVFVGVDAMTSLGGSQYVNGTAGPYADYVIHEVIPQVEADVRTAGATGGRGVVGKSSGGFGALHLAMEYPGTFSAVVCHSGDMGFDQTFASEVTGVIAELDRFPGDEDAKVGAFLQFVTTAVRLSPGQGHALMVLACAAAYSPDPDRRAGFALPFDVVTGEPVAEVWRRWLQVDPLHALQDKRRGAARAQALRALRLLSVDCGSRDQYGLHLGARRMHRLLTQLEIAHQYEEFEDGHSGTQYRYDVSLPRLAAALAEAPAPASAERGTPPRASAGTATHGPEGR